MFFLPRTFSSLLGLAVGWLGVLGAETARLPYGLSKLVLVGMASLALAWRMTTAGSAPEQRKEVFSLSWLFLLATLFTLDTAWIYAISGWGDGSVPYFRPPLNHDGVRNVNVVAALLRGEGSPYLPHANWAYQLFWYHLAALWVGAFPTSPSLFGAVAVVSVGTAWVFNFTLLATMSRLAPERSASRIGWILLLAVCFFHWDLYYGLAGLWERGLLLFEEEWGAGVPIFFRYVSAKSLVLVSPQHALFGVFLLLFSGQRGKGAPVWAFLAFLVSPILWGMIFPWLVLLEWRRTRTFPWSWVGSAVFGFAVYFLLYGHSPVALLMRPQGESPWFPAYLRDWGWRSGLTWVGANGALGLAAMWAWARGRRSYFGLALLGAALVLHFVYTQSETRRYFAVLGVILFPLLLAENGFAGWFHTRARKGIALAFILVGLYFQSSYWVNYLMKPSVVPRGLAWSDYFKMNERLRRDYPGQAVLAAYLPRIGLEKPIAMEAAVSVAHPVEAAIHTQLSAEQFEILKTIYERGTIFPEIGKLDYRLILWGPVEELAWGRSVKEKYIGVRRPLAVEGAVELFEYQPELLPAERK